MEGRGWRGFKYNRNKRKQAGDGQRPSGVDEGLSGRRVARERIVALEKLELKKKNNSIHSMTMAFVDISVLGFNSVISYR
jgi:hypothetical protein